MMIDARRYTSGRIAVANLSAMIDAWNFAVSRVRRSKTRWRCRSFSFFAATCSVASWTMTGAELVATEATALAPDMGSVLYIRVTIQMPSSVIPSWAAPRRVLVRHPTAHDAVMFQ